jgi:hypothetical protein
LNSAERGDPGSCLLDCRSYLRIAVLPKLDERRVIAGRIGRPAEALVALGETVQRDGLITERPGCVDIGDRLVPTRRLIDQTVAVEKLSAKER